MNKIKRIPFDAEKAKKGAKVVTRCGYPVRIGFYDLKGGEFPIAGAVKEKDNTEAVRSFTMKGRHYSYDKDSPYDLFIEEEEQEKTRREYSGTDSIFVPNDDEGIIEELIDAINGLWNNDALPMPLSIKRKDAWLAWLEKQGVEKPADNKPKLKVGDWIVQENVGVYKITKIYKSWYEVIDSRGNYYSILFEQEPMCHLWTIQDAKPGDVLHAVGQHNDCIFIFNRLDNDVSDRDRVFATGYCCLDITADKMEFCVQGPDSIEVGAATVKPVTKIQCDLLFQKMKEAGYDWFPNIKEIHKIKKEVETRAMTNQELADWLRVAPEECREFLYKGGDYIYTSYDYFVNEANTPVYDKLIRRNHGEWQKPLIEE